MKTNTENASNLHSCDADPNVQCIHSKCTQTGSVQTHPCTVYVCTAVIFLPCHGGRFPVVKCLKIEDGNGKCEMKISSSDHRVYLFGKGTAVVCIGTSAVVPVFHLL
jgi:hypothetical protein